MSRVLLAYRSFLTIWLLLIIPFLEVRGQGVIVARVQDSLGRDVPEAYAVAVDTASSVLLAAAFTDNKGVFDLQVKERLDVRLRVSAMGFASLATKTCWQAAPP